MTTKAKEELEEISVLTAEQIAKLPATVKENVVFLTEHMGSNELIVLNPIVVELLEIRKMNEKLVLMPKNEKGEFNKDNIEDYKELKSKQRSFNVKIRETAKTLKEEPAKITKGIIAIEKTFLDENSTIQDEAAKKFADYEAEVVEQARIAKEKKDKALLDKIAEETKAKEEANLGLNRANVYNKVKYELIAKQYTEDVSDAVANFNGPKLEDLKVSLNVKGYETLIGDNDITILDQDVQAELQEYFVSSKRKALASIDARLESIRIEQENAILAAKNATITETVNSTAQSIGQSYQSRPQETFQAPKINIPSGPVLPPPPMFATIEACIANIEYNEYASEDGKPLNESKAWLKLKELISKS